MFQKFLGLCAGRIGQLLNVSSLADDCGISVITAKAWLSILEASYIIFLLQPHHKNFSKRLIKSPKIYFYDTGLACSLLGIESSKELVTHYLRGGLFESLVITELAKYRYNRGLQPRLYFWRDKVGQEIDCIIEQGETLIPVEIKASQTPSSNFFNNITAWNELAHAKPSNAFVVYGGDENQKRSVGNLVSWKSAATIYE
jgi:predicted AAA+ superfamily ATPase